MKCLLDTSTLIWSLMDVDRLSTSAKKLLSDKTVIKHVSAVSFYEMAIKMSIGKLTLQGFQLQDLPALLYTRSVELIVLDPIEAISLKRLPLKEGHRDPFDRMLICQAISRNLTFLSSDEKIAQYRECGLSLIW
jgi:Uncharacterized protein conserved in bacteria